jgi:hypothetical protein
LALGLSDMFVLTRIGGRRRQELDGVTAMFEIDWGGGGVTPRAPLYPF